MDSTDYQQYKKQITNAVDNSIEDIDASCERLCKTFSKAKKELVYCFTSGDFFTAEDIISSLKKQDKFFANNLESMETMFTTITEALEDKLDIDIKQERKKFEQMYKHLYEQLESRAEDVKESMLAYRDELLDLYKSKKKQFPQQSIIYLNDRELYRLDIRANAYFVVVSKLRTKIRGIMTRREFNNAKAEGVTSEKRQKRATAYEEIAHKAEQEQVVKMVKSTAQQPDEADNDGQGIPNDSLQAILSYMTFKEALQVRRVSKHFASMVHTLYKSCWLKSIVVSPMVGLEENNLLWIRKVILWLMYDPALDSDVRTQARNLYFKFNTEYRTIKTFKMECTIQRKLFDLTIATIVQLFKWDKGRILSILFDNSMQNTMLAVHLYTNYQVEFSKSKSRNTSYSSCNSYLPFLSVLSRPIDVATSVGIEKEATAVTTTIFDKMTTLIFDSGLCNQNIELALDSKTARLNLKSIFMHDFIGGSDATMIESVDEYHICDPLLMFRTSLSFDVYWPQNTAAYQKNLISKSTTYHYLHESSLEPEIIYNYYNPAPVVKPAQVREPLMTRFMKMLDSAIDWKQRYAYYIAAGGKVKFRLLRDRMRTAEEQFWSSEKLLEFYERVQNGLYDEFDMVQ